MHRILVKNDCLHNVSMKLLLKTFFDPEYSTYSAILVDSGDCALIVYFFDESLEGFIGRMCKVKKNFSHVDFFNDYAPSGRFNFIFTPSKDCNTFFKCFKSADQNFVLPITKQFYAV
jgi:hypothetical protein